MYYGVCGGADGAAVYRVSPTPVALTIHQTTLSAPFFNNTVQAPPSQWRGVSDATPEIYLSPRSPETAWLSLCSGNAGLEGIFSHICSHYEMDVELFLSPVRL